MSIDFLADLTALSKELGIDNSKNANNCYEAKMIASGLIDRNHQVYSGFNNNYFSVVKYYSKRPVDEWRQLVKDACKILAEHPTKGHLCQLFMDLRSEQFDKDRSWAFGNDYVVIINGIEVDRLKPTEKQIEYSSKRIKEYAQFFEALGSEVANLVFATIHEVEKAIAENEKLRDELMYG